MNTQWTKVITDQDPPPSAPDDHPPSTTHHSPLTTHEIRNRIKAHRRLRAGDLVPHELNFRHHPELQRAALVALYREVGFARSLLAYELPDGRLKLLDGHLRREMDPDMEVDVEILDVTEDEAIALLRASNPHGSLVGGFVGVPLYLSITVVEVVMRRG